MMRKLYATSCGVSSSVWCNEVAGLTRRLEGYHRTLYLLLCLPLAIIASNRQGVSKWERNMDTFAQRVKVLQDESERIKQYLHALPADAWERPSLCTQWQVQDVVAHLIGVAESYASNISRGLQKDTSPPAGRPAAGTTNAAASAEGIAQRSIAARKDLGDRLLSVFESTNNHLNQLLAGLRPEEQQQPCYHPGGIVAAQDFAALRLKELALHEWDIRASLEADAHLSAACFPAILATISESIASGSLRWAFWSGPKLSAPRRYRFVVTGMGPQKPDLLVEGDAIRMEEATDTRPDATFHCDTETYILLIYGRLNLDTDLASGRLMIEGGHEAAKAFQQWFRGI